LFHGHLGGGPTLHAVAGAFLGQGHHEANNDLVTERVGQSRPRQHDDESPAEEDERCLHRVSSLHERTSGTPHRETLVTPSFPGVGAPSWLSPWWPGSRGTTGER